MAALARAAGVAGGATRWSVGAPRADTVGDLPLREVSARGPGTGHLAVLLTGDGGWAKIDRVIADSLTHHGIPVVALDSRAYLSRPRSPEVAARDLGRILRHYLVSLGKHRVMLLGYSRGADVLPFMVARLPADLGRRVELVALLGPGTRANFTFHLIDLLWSRHRPDDLMTVAEIRRLRGMRILCFYGAKERDTACRSLDPSLATSYELPGGHHFGGKYGVIARRLLDAVGVGT
jgi:type IV secretory pathway VirJ component